MSLPIFTGVKKLKLRSSKCDICGKKFKDKTYPYFSEDIRERNQGLELCQECFEAKLK